MTLDAGRSTLDGLRDDKVNILVVDDLPDKLLAFQVVLEELEQNLVLVSSGAEALRELLQRDFAVILLDVNMPDIDGIETAELIRMHGKTAHIPIIFVTAYADDMQTARGYALGAVDYILSPVVPEILRSKVKVFVELYRAQRRAAALAKAEADRHAAEEATRRSEFLALASRELSTSLDLEEAMQKLLTFVVPSCADLAVLSVSTDKTKECLFWRGALDSELGLEQALPELVLHHDASSKIDLLPAPRALAAPPPRTYRLASLAPLPQRLAEALLATRHQGVPNHVPVSGCAPDAPSPWPHDLHDALVLPLLGPNDIVLGALALVHRRALRVPAYADHDLALLEELANRAAIAFDNALLYRNLQREMHRARAAEEKLQEANRRKDEFLAMLSHELRNPLAPIRNATEVMRRIAPADARIGWAREIVERQVKHMAHLVDDLLDVSRITQGKIALRKEPVELGRVIHDSVEAMRELFDARRQHLVLEVPSAPIWVFGDFARLAQVIGNLLNNAAKYTAEGGTIELSADAHHGEAVITVKDNGIGIERDLLPHVFELFMQGERALDRSQGGLGVGLTVVQRLVELHQGRVEAASAGAGTGATFTIVLPCISEVGPAAREGARGGDAGLEARGRRVLVVDDNVDAAETIGVFLRLEGHEVKTVTDGLQALACAQVFAPHVAVVDIGLPGLDGYEVARQLRQQEATAHALLIALTGYGQKEDRDRSDAAGFDHHFVKPADPKTIQDAIDAWIHAGESGRAHPEWAHSS